jgi:hypothetical protein
MMPQDASFLRLSDISSLAYEILAHDIILRTDNAASSASPHQMPACVQEERK